MYREQYLLQARPDVFTCVVVLLECECECGFLIWAVMCCHVIVVTTLDSPDPACLVIIEFKYICFLYRAYPKATIKDMEQCSVDFHADPVLENQSFHPGTRKTTIFLRLHCPREVITPA